MPWIKINWDCKYSNFTLPKVLFRDPDWFFFMIGKQKFDNKGLIAEEAKDLYIKSRNIRIPMNCGDDLVAEYSINPSTGRFEDLELVPRNRAHHSGATSTERKEIIDLNYPRILKEYDKFGNNLLISKIKHYYFGNSSYLMTKKRCEDFYDNEDNFVIAPGISPKKPGNEEIEEAKIFILVIFENDNILESTTIHAYAKGCSISKQALHFAKYKLPIKQFRRDQKWFWLLEKTQSSV
jgi:hypothetical protein